MAIEGRVHNYRKGPVALVDMDTCMKNEASMDGVITGLPNKPQVMGAKRKSADSYVKIC